MPHTDGLKIASLNVGRLLQPRTVEALQRLAAEDDGPDVLMLQDMPFRALPMVTERWPHFMPGVMTNHFIDGKRAAVGLVTLSRYIITNAHVHTTHGDGTFKDLQGINDKNERHLGAESDRLVEATEDRVVICVTIEKEGVEYNFAQTHGMWVRNGVTNDVQRACMRRTLDVVAEWSYFCGGGQIFAGDFNFGRGGEIYKTYAEVFQDCVPPDVDNTLDPSHPFAQRGGRVVSDYVWNCPDVMGYSYAVEDFTLHPGLSDHQMITATVIAT